MNEVLFYILFFAFLACMFKSIEWYVRTRHWREYYIHKCGHREYYYWDVREKLCKNCGVKYRSEDWKEIVMREKYPFVWETAKDE